MYDSFVTIGFLVPLLMLVATVLKGNFATFQMQRRGITNGLPFTKHLGAWSELLLMPFAIGIMANYATQWSSKAISISIVIGLVVSVAMHFSWIKGSKRQEHMLSPEGLNSCGYIHIVYFAGVFAELILFYLGSSPTMHDKVVIAVMVGANTLIGTQGVNLMKDGTIDQPGVIVTLGTWAVLAAAVLFGRPLL